MATERVASFLASKDIHVMYQLTRDELHSVAEEFGVVLQGEKKEELQIELKTFLEKSKWFHGDHEENGEDGEEEKEESPSELLKKGDLEGLSGTEKYELMKLQIELERERIKADKEVQIEKEKAQIRQDFFQKI